MGWKKFTGTVKGITVEGDPEAPVTTWWNLRWLIAFGWKKVAVFQPKKDPHVFDMFVGFRTMNGEAKVSTKPLNDFCFRVRIGRERCTFFVVTEEGTEMPLRLITVTEKADRKFDHFVLV